MVENGIKLNETQKARLSDLNNRFKITLWLLRKLPAAWFMGIRVKSVAAESSVVSLPFSWFSQNPFRSIYFAAQCAAGELATGVLVLVGIAGKGNFSMLVTNVSAEFYKKANTKTLFTCSDGQLLHETVEKCLATGEPHVIEMTATGVQASGEVVSSIKITWSLKARK